MNNLTVQKTAKDSACKRGNKKQIEVRKAVEVQLYTHMYVCSAGVFRGEGGEVRGDIVPYFFLHPFNIACTQYLAILFFSFEKGAKGIQSGVVQRGLL